MSTSVCLQIYAQIKSGCWLGQCISNFVKIKMKKKVELFYSEKTSSIILLHRLFLDYVSSNNDNNSVVRNIYIYIF